MGRPSTYTPESAEAVLEHLASGRSVRSWCARPGRPSRTSVLRWALKDIDGFGAHYREARRIGCEALADDLQDEARRAVGKDMAGVTAHRLVCDVIKWELSKRAPEQFGDRVQHELTGEGAIRIYLPSNGRAIEDAAAK